MDRIVPDTHQIDRRNFLRSAGAGLAAAGAVLTTRDNAIAQRIADKARFDRLATCSYPLRSLFKTRQGAGRRGAGGAGRGAGAGANATGRGQGQGVTSGGPEGATGGPVVTVPQDRDRTTAAEMKQRYGEITALDFPQWTKDHFPGVTKMDLRSALFGDVSDEAMYRGNTFDPTTVAGKRWLDQLANKLVVTGTRIQHVSNNAPTNLADADPNVRRVGVQTAKDWLAGCKALGIVSMRMNSPQALGPSIRPNAMPRGGDGYPRNFDLVPLLDAAIESYKEMADFGGNLGIKVTIENHWGLAADPMNIRIILDAVNHPYCEATPDFCNWEHEHMLFNGLKALAPYATATSQAKYWDRWGDRNDVQRSVRILLAGGFRGVFSLEYEAGPLNGVEGSKYLYKEVLAALTTPTPAI
jgi:sugar phosphate isomerase/epimerase